MKRLFFILTAVVMAASIMAVEKNISPTACGITVGQTTKTGKTPSQWSDKLMNYSPITPLVSSGDHEVYLGDFVVEGFHMSVLDLELMNDTVYKISFYGRSLYADCWDSYKNLAYKLRDKYAHFEDVVDSMESDNDSVVSFYKTDGKTRILFSADPHNLTLSLTDMHFYNIWLNDLVSEFTSVFYGKSGPDYAEENKVTGVAGVKFGDSREYVRKVMSSKAEKILDSDAHSINYYKAKIGGTTYDFATFYFMPDKGLVAVNLSASFDSWQEEEAKSFYKSTVAQYKSKYTNFRETDEEDYAFCGAFTDDYKEMPPIAISWKKALSKGGEMRYYVNVSYYTQRLSGLYNDEI